MAQQHLPEEAPGLLRTPGLSGQDHEQYVHVGSLKVARRKCQVESRWIEFLRTTGMAQQHLPEEAPIVVVFMDVST